MFHFSKKNIKFADAKAMVARYKTRKSIVNPTKTNK